MDSIRYMVDLLLSTRALQLEKQANLDAMLNKCPCHDLIADYLLYRRLLNREQYKLVHDGGFMNAYHNIQNNLKEIEADHNKMESILIMENPCIELKKYLFHNYPKKSY